jgi:hypothetical protein
MIYLMTAFTLKYLKASWGWWVLFALVLIIDLLKD